MNEETVSEFLGWFSIGLGVAEVLMPGRIGRALGLNDRTKLIRAYGVREIVSGVGILNENQRAPWVWARVGGDALDLAAMAPALSADNPKRINATLAFANVMAIAALDIWCARALSERES